MKQMPAHQKSSGNVFEDLGLPNAPELLVKADLVIEILQTIEERGLTQAEAAEVLGIDQPKISALVRGRFTGFSLERLYRFLNALGKDIEIVVRTASRPTRATVEVLTPDRKKSRARAPKRSEGRKSTAA